MRHMRYSLMKKKEGTMIQVELLGTSPKILAQRLKKVAISIQNIKTYMSL